MKSIKNSNSSNTFFKVISSIRTLNFAEYMTFISAHIFQSIFHYRMNSEIQIVYF